MNALEECNVEFHGVPVDLMKGEQNSADYRAVNPKGRVPALQVGGRVLTENVAILCYLHRKHPEVGLLPPAQSLEAEQELLADLLWCSSTLHPLVRQVRNPAKLIGDGDVEALKAKGLELFAEQMERVAERLSSNGPWWHGAHWSIVDVYLTWAIDIATRACFEVARYPILLEHRELVRSRPSFQRALEREVRAAEALDWSFGRI